MTRSSPNEENDESVESVTELLHEYREGKRWAYVSHLARAERRLEPFSLPVDDQRIAVALLELPEQKRAQRDRIREFGARRARSVLQRVLALPTSFAGGRYHLYPYAEHRTDGATWLFEEVEVGITGLRLHLTIWLSWPSDSLPAPLPDVVQAPSARFHPYWWEGFQEVSDDVGNGYTLLGSTMEEEGPLAVTLGGVESIRVAQRYKWWWGPGPQPDAARLIFRGLSAVAAEGSYAPSSPSPRRQVEFGELVCEVSLPDIDPTIWQAVPVRGGSVTLH